MGGHQGTKCVKEDFLFIPATGRSASKHAKALSKRISEAIDVYKEEHNEVTQTDIVQALRLSGQRAGQATQIFLIWLLLVGFVLGVAFFLVSK
jgi:hypothetical protein